MAASRGRGQATSSIAGLITTVPLDGIRGASGINCQFQLARSGKPTFLQLGEDFFSVQADFEASPPRGHDLQFGDALPVVGKQFNRHPGGSRSVVSIVTVNEAKSKSFCHLRPPNFQLRQQRCRCKELDFRAERFSPAVIPAYNRHPRLSNTNTGTERVATRSGASA